VLSSSLGGGGGAGVGSMAGAGLSRPERLVVGSVEGVGVGEFGWGWGEASLAGGVDRNREKCR